MLEDRLYKIDGVLWKLTMSINQPQPLCPKHRMNLHPVTHNYAIDKRHCRELSCEDCSSHYSIPRAFEEEQRYVEEKISAKNHKNLKLINLDDEAIPIADDKVENDEYFVKSILTESKVGLRLIVYAGKKGDPDKSQIFIEPEILRLAFDQTNTHPLKVFTKLEATFPDSSKATLERS